MRSIMLLFKLLVLLLCPWTLTAVNDFRIAVRSLNFSSITDYRSVLVPENWKLQLVCTCDRPPIVACPSANMKWAPQRLSGDITTTQGEFLQPSKITYSAVNWASAYRDANCTQEGQVVPLNIAVFNITGQKSIATELSKPYELQCTFRTNVFSVISAIRVEWYKEVAPGAILGTTDGVSEDRDLNASASLDPAKWKALDFSETLSPKDPSPRYSRSEVNSTETFRIPSSIDTRVTSATHFLLTNKLHISRVSRMDIATYRCVYTLISNQTSENDVPKPVEDWTRTSYASATLYSKPFTISPATQPNAPNFEESLVVRENEPFVVNCNVYGSPVPLIVSWLIRDAPESRARELFTMNSSDSSKLNWMTVYNDTTQYGITIEDYGGIRNGQLRVRSATYAHRGYYECVAHNMHGQVRVLRLIRVKSRYAFVYPLVGIIIELTLLAALIIIYERRKAKASAKADDELPNAENDRAAASTSTNGGSHQAELRYRAA